MVFAISPGRNSMVCGSTRLGTPAKSLPSTAVPARVRKLTETVSVDGSDIEIWNTRALFVASRV